MSQPDLKFQLRPAVRAAVEKLGAPTGAEIAPEIGASRDVADRVLRDMVRAGELEVFLRYSPGVAMRPPRAYRIASGERVRAFAGSTLDVTKEG